MPAEGPVGANNLKKVSHVLEAQSQPPAGPRRHGVTRAAPHQSPYRRPPNPPTTSSPQPRASTPIAGVTRTRRESYRRATLSRLLYSVSLG